MILPLTAEVQISRLPRLRPFVGSTPGQMPRCDPHRSGRTTTIVAGIHTPCRLRITRASLAEQDALCREPIVASTAAAEIVHKYQSATATGVAREVGVVIAATAGEGIVGFVDNAVGDIDVADGAFVFSSDCRCWHYRTSEKCLK